jgi:uncharacterized damage-inducible protein DinB
MNARLQTQFDALEKSRKALFDELKDYPDELLNKKPAADKWSAAQVLEHLVASETASLNYLQKKTLDTSRSKHAGFSGKRRLLVTKLVFYWPLSFKAPPALEPSTSFATLKELQLRWDKVRNETLGILSKLSNQELEKDLWRHLIAGKMNIYQMLEFFGIHFNRHRKQIEQALSVVKNR